MRTNKVFPLDLKTAKNMICLETPHYFLAKYTQSKSDFSQQVYMQMHCLVVVLKGHKIIHTQKNDFTIRSGEGLFLKSDTHIISNITSDNGNYEALLLFFDNTGILDFIHKHKEYLDTSLKYKNFDNLFLRSSSMLTTIAKSFELYLKESYRQKIALFVSHKFEELFLYLSVEYANVFRKFMQDILQGFKLDIRLAFDYVDKEFLNVSQMAEFAKIDCATLSRKFKQTFGISPKHWLDERRFEKARFLLEYSGKNINEICNDCGFSSPSWFIERFKKKYSLTPKQYQKSKNLYFLS